MNLLSFLSQSYPPNIWISEKYIKIYVRKSVRYINNNMVPCLDIASVEVDEDQRGNGIFSGFLNRFEQEAKKLNRGVYVESILNKRLITYLLGKGYAYVPGCSEICPSMFKLLK